MLLDIYPASAVIAGVLLDLIIGDPEYRLHPVRLMGHTISFLEKILYNLTGNRVLNGGLLFIIMSLIWGGSSCLVINNLRVSIPVFLFSVTVIYTLISVKDLRVKSMEVFDALEERDLNRARERVGMIVGRDTDQLEEKEIVRATVETVAENIVDGIISPLFYLMVAGVPGIVLYKMTNTLDSMVGYRNDKYEGYGKISARIDDILNYIPARLSPVIISMAAVLTGRCSLRGIIIALRDGQKNPSPNSGISEAAVAGILGIELGGVNYYKGIESRKPVIGLKEKELEKKDIRTSCRISTATGVICSIIIAIVLYLNEGYLLSL